MVKPWGCSIREAGGRDPSSLGDQIVIFFVQPKGSEFSIHGASVDPVKPQTAIADPEAFEKVVEMTSDKV